MALHCDIVSSESVEGHTEYTIKIVDGSEERLVHRRYSDFRKLDKQVVRRLPRDGRPKLPPKGVFGLRHRLDLFGFNSKREQGLQQYLNDLLQTDSARAPVLDQFLSVSERAGVPTQVRRAAGDQQAPPPCKPATPQLPAEQLEGPSPEPQQRRLPNALRPSVGTWLAPRPLLIARPQLPAAPECPSASVEAAAELPAPPAARCHLQPSVGTWLLPLPRALAKPPASSPKGAALGSGRPKRKQAATTACTCMSLCGVPLALLGRLLRQSILPSAKVPTQTSMEGHADDAAPKSQSAELRLGHPGNLDSLNTDSDDPVRRDASNASTPMSARVSDGTPTGRLVDERRSVEHRWRSARRPLSAVLGPPAPERDAAPASAAAPEQAVAAPTQPAAPRAAAHGKQPSVGTWLLPRRRGA